MTIKVYVRTEDLYEFIAALNDSEDHTVGYKFHTRFHSDHVEVHLSPDELRSVVSRFRKTSDEEDADELFQTDIYYP
jgi:hypothetical protein